MAVSDHQLLLPCACAQIHDQPNEPFGAAARHRAGQLLQGGRLPRHPHRERAASFECMHASAQYSTAPAHPRLPHTRTGGAAGCTRLCEHHSKQRSCPSAFVFFAFTPTACCTSSCPQIPQLGGSNPGSTGNNTVKWRFQPGRFSGYSVVHCHFLMHEGELRGLWGQIAGRCRQSTAQERRYPRVVGCLSMHVCANVSDES